MTEIHQKIDLFYYLSTPPSYPHIFRGKMGRWSLVQTCTELYRNKSEFYDAVESNTGLLEQH